MRDQYSGLPLSDSVSFDVELVSNVILDLKRGKAPDIAVLTAEHLLFSHPVLPVVLSKLFHIMFLCQHVPVGFKCNYIVPVPKIKGCSSKVITYNYFRAIAISPIVSEVFEYSLLHSFGVWLKTGNTQFGFKKGIGCSHAMYTARGIVDYFVKMVLLLTCAH